VILHEGYLSLTLGYKYTTTKCIYNIGWIVGFRDLYWREEIAETRLVYYSWEFWTNYGNLMLQPGDGATPSSMARAEEAALLP
jgi:hypothetical protein